MRNAPVCMFVLALGPGGLAAQPSLGQASAPVACASPGLPPDAYAPPAIPPMPPTPSCIDPKTMVGNCRKPVIDRYNRDVAARNQVIVQRNRETQAYASQLNAWILATGRYAQCESARVNQGVAP